MGKCHLESGRGLEKTKLRGKLQRRLLTFENSEERLFLGRQLKTMTTSDERSPYSSRKIKINGQFELCVVAQNS